MDTSRTFNFWGVEAGKTYIITHTAMFYIPFGRETLTDLLQMLIMHDLHVLKKC